MIAYAAGSTYYYSRWLLQVVFFYLSFVATIAAGYFIARTHLFEHAFYLQCKLARWRHDERLRFFIVCIQHLQHRQ